MVLPLCSTVLAPQQMSLRCNFPEKPSTLRALEFSDIKPQPNDRNIVGCNLLRAFDHPVALCCDMLGVVGSNLACCDPLARALFRARLAAIRNS